MKLSVRKIIDRKYESMMITDYHIISEPKFAAYITNLLLTSLRQSLSELSGKLFSNNEISWPIFTKWMTITQIRPINLLFEEIIGITL